MMGSLIAQTREFFMENSSSTVKHTSHRLNQIRDKENWRERESLSARPRYITSSRTYIKSQEQKEGKQEFSLFFFCAKFLCYSHECCNKLKKKR